MNQMQEVNLYTELLLIIACIEILQIFIHANLGFLKYVNKLIHIKWNKNTIKCIPASI